MRHIDYIMKFHKQYDLELIQEISVNDKPLFYYPGGVKAGGSDGIIVKVIPFDHESWTGIFAYGELSYNAKNGLYAFPNPNKFSVVSRGNGYIVNSNNPTKWEKVKLQVIKDVFYSKDLNLIIYANPWEICAYESEKMLWQTGRIALEGLKILKIDKRTLFGKIDMLGEEEIDFVVNLENGKCEGGLSF